MREGKFAEDYLSYQINRSWLRKTIRRLFLCQVEKSVIGNVIDFGCGIGEHLSLFSKNSIGLEINEYTVKYCQQKGLNVRFYDPAKDNYLLKDIPEGKYQTLVINHVMEHLEYPENILKTLMDSCNRIGVRRIYIAVPCEAGFTYDKTHITFIDKDFIKNKGLDNYSGFKIVKWGYFPFNLRFVGKFFTHNEFFVVYNSQS